MKWSKRIVLGTIILLALMFAPAALAWHANGVTVQSVCDAEKQTYNITAAIEQSEEFPGAFIVSVTPSSVPGDTTGSVSVVVVIGWTDTTDTQTFETSVQVDGTCKPETPSPPDNGPKDWCPNIDFTQQDGPPPGMVIDENGNCVVPPVAEVVVPPPAPEPPPPPVEEPPVIVEEEEPEVTEPEVAEEPPTIEEAPEAVPSPQKPKPTPPTEELPFTGGPSWPPIVAGLALIAAGLGMRRLG